MFTPKGSKRYSHQIDVLKKIIETKGVTALLNDPGTGKTAPTLDYLSMLALKMGKTLGSQAEIRVLAVSPKVAVDNWVIQAEHYIHDDVDVWAEALGGSIRAKAQTMANRGENAARPRKLTRKKDAQQVDKRILNYDRAELLYTRGFEASEGLQKASGQPRVILLSTNYETFASRASRGSRTVADDLVDAVKRFQPHVIVCDESHKIKGVSSNTSRFFARIAPLVPRRLILTGTPMPNSPMDIFAQWRFLEPTAFGSYDPVTRKRRSATFGGFRSRYGVMGGFMGREVVSYQNLDEMQSIMAKNAIVVKKKDALDLPDRTPIQVPVTLSPKEQELYNTMKKELAAKLESGEIVSSPNRLAQMMRLRQITAGYLPTEEGEIEEIGSSKVDTIAGIANDTLEGEKRIVIFTMFRHEVTALQKALHVKGTEILTITGDTSQDERLSIRRRFGSDDPKRLILIAQIQTISLSVNELVTASHAIFASLSQRRDDLIQAQDRLHRIGQKLPVTFWFALARGTIDEVIYRSHLAKTDLEEAVLKHIQDLENLEEITT